MVQREQVCRYESCFQLANEVENKPHNCDQRASYFSQFHIVQVLFSTLCRWAYMGWGITTDIYDKKFKELQSSQDKIKSKINNLHYADKDYFITASYVLDLTNRAHELFVSS